MKHLDAVLIWLWLSTFFWAFLGGSIWPFIGGAFVIVGYYVWAMCYGAHKQHEAEFGPEKLIR